MATITIICVGREVSCLKEYGVDEKVKDNKDGHHHHHLIGGGRSAV